MIRFDCRLKALCVILVVLECVSTSSGSVIRDGNADFSEASYHHGRLAPERQNIIHNKYLTFDEMMEWLHRTVAQCSYCSLVNIGYSYEWRPMPVVQITYTGQGSSRTKPSVWIDAGIHAREWVSHSTALFFIDKLANGGSDGDTRYLLEAYDWYILPCVNPDGYHFTHTEDRLWRKTRSRNNGTACLGVDANRNFGFHWDSVGTSGDPCTDVYRGPVQFSEPETRAVRDFIMSRKDNWKLFITLHSYAQKILLPFGYTVNKPSNYEDMMLVGSVAKEKLESVYGTKYTVGSASDVLYQSSGTSRDWAAGVPQIPYVYTIELRDTGNHGFVLPPSHILPTGIETWEAVKSMANSIILLDREDFYKPERYTDFLLEDLLLASSNVQ